MWFDFFLTFFYLFILYIFIGDNMKKDFWIPLIVSIILGFVSAQIVYSTYRKNLDSIEYNAYFLMIDNNDESTETVFSNEFNYLSIDNSVYVGITTSLNNAHKIKNIYDNNNIKVEIVPSIIDNVEFISNLEQYDILISEVSLDENIISISDAVLSSYEEIVLGN